MSRRGVGAAFVVQVAIGVVGCGKNLAGNVPPELATEWRGGKGDPHSLTIANGSMSTTNLICSATFKLESLAPTEPATWKFKAARDGEKPTAGTIKLGNDGVVEISADGDSCFEEGLAGKFRRVDAIKFPADTQGTWFSCDAKACPRVKVLITEKTFAVTGTGGSGHCITGTATISDVAVDGPITKVNHSGLVSSGWDLSIIKEQDGLELSGADTFAGHYTKKPCDQRVPSRPTPEPEANPARASGKGDQCLVRCGAEQNACVLRCGGAQSCIVECAAKGQVCVGGC